MKITKEQFKKIVREVLTEENEYQAFFQKALDKAGKSIPSMSEEEKKAFFDKIDAAWQGKGEKNEEFVNEDKSKKNRFLGVFAPGKKVFQRVIKNVDAASIDNLIKYTKSNGDDVEKHGASSWATTKDSKKNGQTVWSYDGKDLMFVNPNTPSIYDEYIRKKLKEDMKHIKLYEELVGGQKELDVDGDGDISGDDLADLRAGKKADESINEEDINWGATENAIINFLKANTKILDKRVKDRDTDGVKKGLQSIIDGLTNAQRSLKLK